MISTRSLNRVRLESDESQLPMPCARKVGSTRDSFPKLNCPGAAKQEEFRTGMPDITLRASEPAVDLSQSALTLGRMVPAPKRVARSLGAELDIASGKPLANVVIPLNCHPATSLSAIPEAFER